jgi:hypothetical protein
MKKALRFDEPKLKIMGIEAVKSSTPQVCRGKIKGAIKIIMSKERNLIYIVLLPEFKNEFFTICRLNKYLFQEVL